MLEILPEHINYPISNNYRISIYYDSDSQDGSRIEIGKAYLESVVDKDEKYFLCKYKKTYTEIVVDGERQLKESGLFKSSFNRNVIDKFLIKGNKKDFENLIQTHINCNNSILDINLVCKLLKSYVDNSELNQSIQEEELDELQEEYITFFNIGEVENQKCVLLKNKYMCSYGIPNKIYGISKSRQQDVLNMSQFVLKAMYGKYSGEDYNYTISYDQRTDTGDAVIKLCSRRLNYIPSYNIRTFNLEEMRKLWYTKPLVSYMTSELNELRKQCYTEYFIRDLTLKEIKLDEINKLKNHQNLEEVKYEYIGMERTKYKETYYVFRVTLEDEVFVVCFVSCGNNVTITLLEDSENILSTIDNDVQYKLNRTYSGYLRTHEYQPIIPLLEELFTKDKNITNMTLGEYSDVTKAETGVPKPQVPKTQAQKASKTKTKTKEKDTHKTDDGISWNSKKK